MQRTNFLRKYFELNVSILTRAFARVQPKGVFCFRGCTPSFNPHSSFRPSATCAPRLTLPKTEFVSILTRAFARVQPTEGGRKVRIDDEFQSSLELSPECNVELGHRGGGGLWVSILTRAFARVQPGKSTISAALALQFQSSLELSPECNLGASRRLGPIGRRVSILTRAFARVQPV